MDRHQFNAEDREGIVAELTEQRVRGWTRLLLAGDRRAQTDLQNLVLDRLSELDAAVLFAQAVLDPDAAGVLFTEIVAKLMRDQCEAEAEKAASDMERRRAESRDDNRIAMAMH